MRRYFAVLGLLAAFLAPALLESAPAPPRDPAVYALVHVRKGNNEQTNAKRVDTAVDAITRGVPNQCGNPEIRKLAVAQGKESEEVGRWLKARIRVRTLEDTSVIRVWLTGGSPEEQVVILNASLRAYMRVIAARQDRLRRHVDHCKKQQAAAKKEFQPDFIKEIQEHEEECNSLPYVLEWAAVRSKR